MSATKTNNKPNCPQICVKPFFSSTLEPKFEEILHTVNSEYKQITLACCLDHTYKGRAEIRRDFKKAVKGAVKTPDNSVFSHYLDGSFVPAVVKKRTTSSRFLRCKNNYWALTDFGLDYAKPIASFSMKYSVDHSPSLSKVLGLRPDVRAKILLYLDQKSANEAELSRFLSIESSGVREHLRVLQVLGLLTYESVCTESSGWATYKWAGRANPRTVSVDFLHNPQIGSTNNILGLYLGNPMDGIDYTRISTIFGMHSKNTSVVIGSLYHQHLLSRDKWTNIKMSEAKITKKGSNFVKGYLHSVADALDNGSELAKMRELQFKAFDYAPHAAKIYAKGSNLLNRRPLTETASRIKAYIRLYMHKHRNLPRASEISGGIGRSVGLPLFKLVKCKMLKRIRIGRASRYLVADDS